MKKNLVVFPKNMPSNVVVSNECIDVQKGKRENCCLDVRYTFGNDSFSGLRIPLVLDDETTGRVYKQNYFKYLQCGSGNSLKHLKQVIHKKT